MRGWAWAVALAVIAAPPVSAGPEAPVAAMDHVAISVADLDRSAAFYKGLFGFREFPAPVPQARWLVMGNGVLLHIVGNRAAPTVHSRWDHLAIAAGNMDAFVAKLDAQRIGWMNMEGKHLRQVRSDGVQQIFIQDPDGYWIEVNDSLRPH